MAEEEDLLVEHGLIPRLFLTKARCDAVHQPNRALVGLQVEQATVEIQVPCCLQRSPRQVNAGLLVLERNLKSETLLRNEGQGSTDLHLVNAMSESILQDHHT